MNASLKLVVFDVDGTLVDSQHVIVACMTAAFAAHDLAAPDPHQVRRIVGLPLEVGIARLRPDLDPLAPDAIADSYRAAFRASRTGPSHEEALFPGVERMLADLAAAGFVLGIATGKSKRGLVATLERHGLTDFFATLQTGDLPPGKPHPAMLLRALEETGIEPAAAVMIGDTSFDMEMAAAAGTLPIGVTWGYHESPELMQAGAVHLVESCGAVPRLLQQMATGAWPLADAASTG
jgi:phosphoglycolate phosphatase